MSFILDSSVALSWCFEDERTPATAALLDRIGETGATAPQHWPLEALNGLIMAERRNRLDAERRRRLARFLGDLPITLDPETSKEVWTATQDLAERYRLTVYDAAYLELALRQRLPLASLDGPLRAAGAAAGVTLPSQLDGPRTGLPSVIARLAEIPEEEIWLQKQKSARTRRAYRQDVEHFMRTLAIAEAVELRQADHKAVIAWERHMREVEHAAASTIRRRLAALSSLYKHLVRHGHAARNPVGEVERPAINRDEGSTLAFSKAQARKILDAPPVETPKGELHIAGLRDRAILSVGLQVGLRRAEIAALRVGDLHQNRGYDALRVMRKGGRRDALAINPQTAARLRAYLEAAGHGTDVDGPLFRPLKHNGKRQEERRRMDPDAIDRVVRKYAARIGLDRGYSAHSMRATFITTALENGAQLEDVQKAAGHRDPSTTKLYDRRGYNPEKAASFFAMY